MEPEVYFTHLHDVECNQKYSKTLPYSFHLGKTYKQGVKFKHLIYKNCPSSAQDWANVITGLWGHDSLEGDFVTYNDLKALYGEVAAEIIYRCTDERGRTRLDRHSDKQLQELAEHRLAVFVKLCDLIANVKFGLLDNSSMFHRYKGEYPRLKGWIYREEFKEMFDYLEQLFSITQ